MAERLAFVVPSFFMVVGISMAYVRFGGLWWMQALFYGIGAAVIAIIARSAYKLVNMTLGKANVREGTIAHTLADARTIFRDKVKYPYENLPEGLRRHRQMTHHHLKTRLRRRHHPYRR